MESKHTPGPWKVIDWLQGKIAVRGSPKDPRQYRADTPQSRICEIFMNHQLGRNYSYTDEDRANARLIAAAPELLDALEEFMEIMDVGYGFPDREKLVSLFSIKAKMAIAKVKGAK